jgi:hypothetical protein
MTSLSAPSIQASGQQLLSAGIYKFKGAHNEITYFWLDAVRRRGNGSAARQFGANVCDGS